LRKPTDQQSQSNVGHQGQKRRIPELLFGYTKHGGILFVGDEGLPDYLERVRHSCSNHPLRHDSIVWRRLRREWLEPDRNVVARFLENRPTLILGRDPTSGRTS